MSNPKHSIEASDGKFTVLCLVPTVIATFVSAEDAELFVAAVEGRKSTTVPPASVESDAAPAKRVAPVENGPSFARAPAVPPRSPSQIDWDRAFVRLEQGENMTTVANSMRLPFTVLRGKWANRKRTEAAEILSPEPPAAPQPKATDVPDGAYGRKPVRGAILSWSVDDDARVAAAREDELPEIALELGRSVDVLKARRQLLERQVAREIGNV